MELSGNGPNVLVEVTTDFFFFFYSVCLHLSLIRISDIGLALCLHILHSRV